MILSFKYYKPQCLISVIAALTIGLTFGLPLLYEKYLVSLPSWFMLPSMLTILLSVFYFYDKYLWKYFPCLIKVPKIAGRYKGKLISDYDEKTREIVVEITQTASGIFLRQFTKDITSGNVSQSKSISCDIIVSKDTSPEVIYYYQNDGHTLVDGTEKHWGLCKLDYTKSKKYFSGTYFTDRDKPTAGTLSFEYISEKTTGDFDG